MFSRGHDINYLISYELHVDRSTHRRASHKKIGKERKEENSSARLGKVGERYCPSDITRSSFFSSLFFFFSPRVTARPFQGVLFYRIMDRIRGVYEGGKEREYRGPAVKIVYRPFSRRIPPTAGFLLPLFKLARITHSSWNNSLEEVEFF